MSGGVNDHTLAYRLHSKMMMCLTRQGHILIYGYGLRVNPRVGPGRVKILALGRVRVRVRLLDHGSGRVDYIRRHISTSKLTCILLATLLCRTSDQIFSIDSSTFGVELLGSGSGNMALDIVQANAGGRRFDR